MTREVNISLRGFLEDLPQEVVELLTTVSKKAFERADDIRDIATRLGDPEEVDHCLVDLDQIRREFYKIDSRLGDCMSILSGYREHLYSVADDDNRRPESADIEEEAEEEGISAEQ